MARAFADLVELRLMRIASVLLLLVALSTGSMASPTVQEPSVISQASTEALPSSPGATPQKLNEMKVVRLGIDILTHDPVVILKELQGERTLPILIGPFEATCIALGLEGTSVPRPLSHDLLKSVIEALDAKVVRIVIHCYRDETFYAKLVLESKAGITEIDARPSDCIALALRTKSPIYATETIRLEEPIEDNPDTTPQSRRVIDPAH